ncbi:MAG: EF-hand domain-containing protein [Proteobacteria bacterium]|nr:EF-hand domain-containing protein [Pseudomonadota bacterium]
MKRIIAYSLIGGGFLVVGAAIAASMPDRPDGPDGPRHHDRAQMAAHFLEEFDLNKDGKVTKAEVDQVMAQRFKEAALGSASVTLDQFIQAHMKDFREHEQRRFQHLDKNGDGKLTADEFEGRHADMFEHMDRNKDGVITKDEVMPPPGDDMDGPPPPEKPE